MSVELAIVPNSDRGEHISLRDWLKNTYAGDAPEVDEDTLTRLSYIFCDLITDGIAPDALIEIVDAIDAMPQKAQDTIYDYLANGKVTEGYLHTGEVLMAMVERLSSVKARIAFTAIYSSSIYAPLYMVPSDPPKEPTTDKSKEKLRAEIAKKPKINPVGRINNAESATATKSSTEYYQEHSSALPPHILIVDEGLRSTALSDDASAIGYSMERPVWQELALCAETDPESFFPEKGGSTREAKKVCTGCEVKVECLEYALGAQERFGIWGGLSERERRRLQRSKK